MRQKWYNENSMPDEDKDKPSLGQLADLYASARAQRRKYEKEREGQPLDIDESAREGLTGALSEAGYDEAGQFRTGQAGGAGAGGAAGGAGGEAATAQQPAGQAGQAAGGTAAGAQAGAEQAQPGQEGQEGASKAEETGAVESAEDLDTLGGPLGAAARAAGVGRQTAEERVQQQEQAEKQQKLADQQTAMLGGRLPSGKKETREQRKEREKREKQRKKEEEMTPEQRQKAREKRIKREQKLRVARAQAARKAKKQQIKAGLDKDYPYPISTFRFMGFCFMAFSMDFVTLIFDLLDIGWLISYLLALPMWFAYWYLILRRAPKPLVGSPLTGKPGPLWKRSFLMLVIEYIPVIGELWIGWSITSVFAWAAVKWYERGRGSLWKLTEQAAGKAGEGKKAGSRASASAGAAASSG